MQKVTHRYLATSDFFYPNKLGYRRVSLAILPLAYGVFTTASDQPRHSGIIKGPFAHVGCKLHTAMFPILGKSCQLNSSPEWGATMKASWWMCPDMGNNLKKLRNAAGWTLQQAADNMGVSYGQYVKLERGERRFTTDHIRIAAEAFGVSPAEVIDPPNLVPIVGLAGAGPDGSVIFASEQDNLGEAPMPPGGNPGTVAVEIRGDSMRGIGDNGWLFYFDDRREPVTEDLIGELCIVGLENGQTLVKKLYRGRGEGLFDLESTNAPTLRDQKIVWAALITAIIPARAARRVGLR